MQTDLTHRDDTGRRLRRARRRWTLILFGASLFFVTVYLLAVQTIPMPRRVTIRTPNLSLSRTRRNPSTV